jgi:hypothetical protein
MSFLSTRRKTTRVLAGVAATLAVIVGGFIAGISAAQATEQGAGRENGFTLIRSDTVQRSFTSGAWVDVPGTEMSLQTLQSSVIIARFGAQSICEGPDGWCSIRILIATPHSGGFQEANPVDGSNFVWQWTGSRWGATMIERHVTDVVLPGNSFQDYFVKVQVKLREGATRLRLQDWTLAVQIFK